MFRSYRDKVRMPTVKTGEKRTPAGYDCNLCDRGGWLTENDVEIHRKSAHFKEINTIRFENYHRFCSVCMELLESKEDLIRHIKSRHFHSSPNAQRVEREIYICDICTNIFFNKHLFIAHMQLSHLSKKPNERSTKSFKCPACFREFQLKCMYHHCQMHGLPSISACDICLKNFPSRADLSEHLKTHNRFYTCDTCQYSTTRESFYDAHLKSHPQRDDIGDIPDDVVAKVFMRHKLSYQFLYNVHNPMKGLCPPSILDICTLCREMCSSKEDAKLHILRDHMEEIHVQKKLHVCLCGEEFDHKVFLKQHLMKTKGCKRPQDDVQLEETTSELVIPWKRPKVYTAKLKFTLPD